MPESPCHNCGELTSHTDDDDRPMCPLCTEALVWQRIVLDIAEGRLDVSAFYDENGRLDTEAFKAAVGPGGAAEGGESL